MPLDPTSLPTDIDAGEQGHIGDSETVHSVINELTSTDGADRVGTASGQTVEEALGGLSAAVDNVADEVAPLPDRVDAVDAATRAAEAAADGAGMIVYDTMRRPDHLSQVGPTDSGHTYTVHAGTWGISSEHIKAQPLGTFVSLTLDTGVADHIVEASVGVAATSPSAAVVVRATNNDNCLIVRLAGSGVRLLKRVAGVETQLATFTGTSQSGRRRRFRVVASGATISVLDVVTGLAVGSHTLSGGDETTFGSATRVGFGDLAAGATRASMFKNLVVRGFP